MVSGLLKYRSRRDFHGAAATGRSRSVDGVLDGRGVGRGWAAYRAEIGDIEDIGRIDGR